MTKVFSSEKKIILPRRADFKSLRRPLARMALLSRPSADTNGTLTLRRDLPPRSEIIRPAERREMPTSFAMAVMDLLGLALIFLLMAARTRGLVTVFFFLRGGSSIPWPLVFSFLTLCTKVRPQPRSRAISVGVLPASRSAETVWRTMILELIFPVFSSNCCFSFFFSLKLTRAELLSPNSRNLD